MKRGCFLCDRVFLNHLYWGVSKSSIESLLTPVVRFSIMIWSVKYVDESCKYLSVCLDRVQFSKKLSVRKDRKRGTTVYKKQSRTLTLLDLLIAFYVDNLPKVFSSLASINGWFLVGRFVAGLVSSISTNVRTLWAVIWKMSRLVTFVTSCLLGRLRWPIVWVPRYLSHCSTTFSVLFNVFQWIFDISKHKVVAGSRKIRLNTIDNFYLNLFLLVEHSMSLWFFHQFLNIFNVDEGVGSIT